MVKKNTKHALLMSVLSLLLCCSMLIGTTFAWFTDTVERRINKITAGNLDVEVYHSKAADPEAIEANKVTGATNIFTDAEGKQVLWEPGVVAYTNLKVVNEGSLALKYQLAINFENENYIKDTNAKLSEVLKVAFLENAVSGTREEILAAAQGQGVLLSSQLKSGTLLAETNKVYGVVIYWEPSDADNNWNVQNGKETSDGQALHIDLGLKLVATQKDAESDSFGNDYDKNASVTVSPDGPMTLAQAIAQVENGGIVFVEPGEYTLNSMIVVDGKSLSIIGLGDVYITTTANQHMFTIQDQYDPESDVVVNLSNLTLDGKGVSKHGINVKYNVTVNMENVTVKNTGWAGVLLDNANMYNDGKFYEGTATRVNMDDCDIVSVSLDALPVVDSHSYANAGVTTYAYLNYDPSTTIGSLEIQKINKEPVENIFINGVTANTIGTTMNLYVKNDAELAEALNTIKTNSAYWNKQVYVHLAAGTYSGDYVINQYPQWNGVVGAGNSGNNYASGVPAGDPGTVITFIGEAATTYSLRAASAPAVVFTGKVTVNGFGNAGTSFDSTSAITTFQNVAFDGANIAPVDGNVISVELTAAADNVYFENCAFQNTTHVVLGYRAENRIDNVYFTGCTFTDAGSLSGYPLSVDLTDCIVDGADDGFLNIQNKATVSVAGTTANVGRFFIRTNGTDVEVTVQDSNITVYESEGTKHLVYFRGSNESAEFIDCTISDGWTTAGVDANSTLEVINYFEDEAGAVLYTDAMSGKVVLYSVAEVTAAEYSIPENVTTLRSGLFTYNTAIKTVSIPASVTDFGGVAQENGKGASGSPFKNSAVETIVLADGITELTPSAIEQAVNLKSINIPASVTAIGIEALAGTGLTELTIPATVTNIGYGAFRDNKNLTTVTIEGNVYIPAYTFRSCTALETVYIKGIDVTFEKGMIFTCYDTGDGRGIEIHVPNEEIKARLLAADSAATTYGGYTVICDSTADENGVYTDNNGDTYAYASSSDTLATAITNGADTVYLSSGKYIIPDVTSGETLTIVGNGSTTVASQDDGASEGDGDYSLRGSTVTFENVIITTSTTYFPGYVGVKATYNNCTINGVWSLYDDATFKNCTFNVSGDVYNVWTWGAAEATFNGCTFNNDGKAVLLYGGIDTKLTMNSCVFNDNGGLTDLKAAIEIGNDYGRSYELIVNNATVNGYEINDKGINTGTTLWANKNSMGTDKLNVVVDGVDVY